ncbi:hypothetical protein HDV02_005752 [Globomyces sp. JEL0801]|nr:hypothetical protein HDV02_005752 [Globomyces sp. JEL0801]
MSRQSMISLNSLKEFQRWKEMRQMDDVPQTMDVVNNLKDAIKRCHIIDFVLIYSQRFTLEDGIMLIEYVYGSDQVQEIRLAPIMYPQYGLIFNSLNSLQNLKTLVLPKLDTRDFTRIPKQIRNLTITNNILDTIPVSKLITFVITQRLDWFRIIFNSTTPVFIMFIRYTKKGTLISLDVDLSFLALNTLMELISCLAADLYSLEVKGITLDYISTLKQQLLLTVRLENLKLKYQSSITESNLNDLIQIIKCNKTIRCLVILLEPLNHHITQLLDFLHQIRFNTTIEKFQFGEQFGILSNINQMNMVKCQILEVIRFNPMLQFSQFNMFPEYIIAKESVRKSIQRSTLQFIKLRGILLILDFLPLDLFILIYKLLMPHFHLDRDLLMEVNLSLYP